MKQKSTLFLKITVILMGLPVFGLCVFGLFQIPKEIARDEPFHVGLLFLALLCATAIPFFIALFQAFKLLCYIDKNTAFSELSVRALKNIKFCAVAIGVFYACWLPLWRYAAEQEDAPGLIIIGGGVAFGSIVVAVFAAVLQKLLQNAIELKSENDLTV